MTNGQEAAAAIACTMIGGDASYVMEYGHGQPIPTKVPTIYVDDLEATMEMLSGTFRPGVKSYVTVKDGKSERIALSWVVMTLRAGTPLDWFTLRANAYRASEPTT